MQTCSVSHNCAFQRLPLFRCACLYRLDNRWQLANPDRLRHKNYEAPARKQLVAGTPFVCLSAGSPQQHVDNARVIQQQVTQLLAQLMEAKDAAVVASQHVDSLTEQFFMVATTYLTMAKKEGNTEVVRRLETAIKAAWEEKQRTLRPEIQLLNKLLAKKERRERLKLLNESPEVLTMNDRYFFALVERMTADVERQPAHQGKGPLLRQLKETKEAAEHVVSKHNKAAESGAS